ncbi:MAG TPA: FlgD immunoglobulin-like domain containing protein [Patescibacteria group bacterium]|nr:FlgD immunoglobulin-like domain containing protein [Patescibacteria group bacterium]
MKVLVLSFLFCSVYSAGAASMQDSTNTKTIITVPKFYPTEKVITGDTLVSPRLVRDSIQLPGAGTTQFTPEQDSAYARAMRLRLPAVPRFQLDAFLFAGTYQSEQEAYENSPYKIAERNLQLPDEVYQPSGEELTAHQYNIEQSMRVPFVNTMPRFGLRIPMSAVGRFLGVTEDVTPTMRYVVEYAMAVEVVVYSTQAVIIATVFKAPQSPGRYEVTWNGRDDKGRRMPTGDYIGEVRLSDGRTIRKRIEIP